MTQVVLSSPSAVAVVSVFLSHSVMSCDHVLPSPDPYIHTSAGHCYYDACAQQLNKQAVEATLMYFKHTQSSFKMLDGLPTLAFLGTLFRDAMLTNRS